MLYRPEAFEPLTESPWDEQRVRAAIRGIVVDVDHAFDPDALWPADDWDGWQSAVPMKNLYVGAAGVVWALDTLRRRGHAETKLDLAAAAKRTLRVVRETPDFMAGVELPAPPESALLTGETGILLVAWRLDPSRRTRARPARARAPERRQRGGRSHVGHAGDSARRPRNARVGG